MKQTILTLMLLLALSGCIKEDNDGCPDYIRLTFLHDGSSEEFDRKIGNDVYLYLYYNDQQYTSIRIPYEEIKGGKEYLIRKELTGNMDIVAWSSPAGNGNAEDIPVPDGTTSRSGQNVAMKAADEEGYYEGLQDVYLGTAKHVDTDISQGSAFEISLANCVCQFSASLNPDADDKNSTTESRWYFEVNGIKSKMNLDFEPLGDDAVVKTALTWDEQTTSLQTGISGLLPSAEDQYVSVLAYRDGDHIFTVHTRHQAKPGDVIHLEIVRETVVISINDWIVYDSKIEWM